MSKNSKIKKFRDLEQDDFEANKSRNKKSSKGAKPNRGRRFVSEIDDQYSESYSY
jgi:hypothetical protein